MERCVRSMLLRLARRITPLLALGALVLAPTPGLAADFDVDRTDDDPAATACSPDAAADCSLRGAVLAANQLDEPSTIRVPAGVYVLTQSSPCTFQNRGDGFTTSTERPLCLARDISIEGEDAATTIVDAGGRSSVVFVSANATASLRRLTVRNGLRAYGGAFAGGGGGIDNQGTLSVAECVVTQNQNEVFGGGGIYNVGALSVERSTISGNSVLAGVDAGGGIYNAPQGVVRVSDSTLLNNVAAWSGGGILNDQGQVEVIGSTLEGNEAELYLGGAIANLGSNLTGSVRLTNTTVSGNRSGSSGGGLYNGQLAEIELRNVTITANTGGLEARGTAGGLSNFGKATLRNTIIAGNADAFMGTAPDCEARQDGGFATALISEGFNLIGSTAGCAITGDVTGNVTDTDPGLGPLADNGGFTRTHAPLAASPALDAGDPAPPGDPGACAALDQRGLVRPAGSACDIGALEARRGLEVSELRPSRGGDAGSVSITLFGSGFSRQARVELRRAGQGTRVADAVATSAGSDILSASFDLTGAARGAWDVVVANPDGGEATLADAFTVESSAMTELWTRVIGLEGPRVGRPTRYFIEFGNRGNQDLLGVPLTLMIPATVTWALRFPILPPPPAGEPVAPDWDRVRIEVAPSAAAGGVSNLPLLLPVVPGGFSGLLELTLTPQVAPDEPSPLVVAIDPPILTPTLANETVQRFLDGASSYALAAFGETFDPALRPQLGAVLQEQMQRLVEDGRRQLVDGAGALPPVASYAQLQLDLAVRGLEQTLVARRESPLRRAVDLLSTLTGSIASRLAALPLPPSALAAGQNCPPAKTGELLGEGCSGGGDPKIGPADDPSADQCKTLDDFRSGRCQPSASQCLSLPNHHVVTASNGDEFCAPDRPGRECPAIPVSNPFTGTAGATDCGFFPLRPKNSHDPNDKRGSLGLVSTGVLAPPVELAYQIQFENLPSATAPAQEVVITDVLDGTAVDLSTFTLGPIGFGDLTLLPAPGVQSYTGAFDLRPAQNLLVLVQAGLDVASGVATWSLRSVDPDTLELPEDPDAGFLPPNTAPPAGEGMVAFRVSPHPEIASGESVCNRATIVFDVNAPIETPEWCNTLDSDLPSSRVEPMPPLQTDVAIPLAWSGSDVGSGILDYQLWVSRDGEPFAPAGPPTSATASTFTGEAGHAYAFYTVARDLAGNAEAAPALPDAETWVDDGGAPRDLAVTQIRVPRRVKLDARRASVTRRVKVKLQNRGPEVETIPDPALLADLVELRVSSLGSCPDPGIAIVPPKKRARGVPLSIAPRKKLQVGFDVTFDCANDPGKSTRRDPGREDFDVAARVRRASLDGRGDAHAFDDLCPRRVETPLPEAFADGRLLEKGCGVKRGGVLGGPILVDVVQP